MPDMLVKLYDLKEDYELYHNLEEQGIRIKKALSPDRSKILTFISENFSEQWVNECKAAFANNPITCYIAEEEKQVIGFACYDATAKNFFGPTGVLLSARGKGIGKALTIKCMHSMWEAGYGYAIIGWTDVIEFYEKTVGATVIPGSTPGIYKRMIGIEK